jgi:SAM-dependent methyltransferase
MYWNQKMKQLIPNQLFELLLAMKYSRQKLPNRTVFEEFTKNKKGIEIGGPSAVFKTILPIYRSVHDLDGVNFSHDTVWEGTIRRGRSYNYIGNRKGLQLVAEATDLGEIETNTYDFLLSSNCLEHVANPIKALLEWKRIVKTGGALILVLPNKSSNFDHRRPCTTFEHIRGDYENEIDERDLTHLHEILTLHDLSMDAQAGDSRNFEKRSLDNFKNRTLHHHVFDMKLMMKVLGHLQLDVVATWETKSDYFALAVKAE